MDYANEKHHVPAKAREARCSRSRGCAGWTSSDSRAATAAGVPKCQNLNRSAAKAVVKEVMDPLKMKATDAASLGVCREQANPGLGSKEGKCLIKLLVDRPRREGPV